MKEGRPSSRSSRARRGKPPGPGEPRSLEDALRRLEEIAAQLEAGTLDLETALRLYREARELHASCVARLSEVEQEARILTEEGLEPGEIPPEE